MLSVQPWFLICEMGILTTTSGVVMKTALGNVCKALSHGSNEITVQ